MTPAEITALVTALGGGVIIRDLGGWLFRSLTGRESRKRDDTQKAWGYYDRESRLRRKLERHAAVLELALIRAGVPPDEIPPWPVTGHTGLTDLDKNE